MRSLTFLFVKLHVFYSETHHRHMSKIYLLSQNCSSFRRALFGFGVLWTQISNISKRAADQTFSFQKSQIKHFSLFDQYLMRENNNAAAARISEKKEKGLNFDNFFVQWTPVICFNFPFRRTIIIIINYCY